MDAARWTDIKAVFADAVVLRRQQRVPWLAARCDGDPELHSEVAALLEAHDRATGFLDDPALVPAREVFERLLTADAPAIGQRVGPFQLLERLGAGGMGVVYRAGRVDGGYEQQVAIKLIALPLHDAEALSRFLVERQILASLTHPNIVSFIDGGLTGDRQAFLVMELVDGAAVTTHCESRQLDLEARLRLFETICGAVQHAHQHGVVHRDLKPGNILVNGDGVVKVLDFGVAKLAAAGAADATLTGVVRPLTPDYASPEQLRGLPVTTASDIYALGVVLYELIAGARPYETTGQPLERVLSLVATDDPQRPSQALLASARRPPYDASRLRGDLDAIVMKAMRKDPSRRYASAQELGEDVARHRAAKPVSAHDHSLAYLIGRAARRHRAAATAAVVSLVAIMGALGVSLWQTREAMRERDRAQARFNDARQIAQALIFKIHDGVAALPGSTPLRQQIVAEALVYLERLSQDPSVDDGLRRELAQGYKRIGEVQGSRTQPNLGDRRASLVNYQRAAALLAPIIARPQADAAAVRELASLELETAATEAALGDGKAATATVTRATRRIEELIARGDASDQTRSLLANCYFRVALSVPVTEALPHWEKAGGIYEAMLAEQPTNPERMRNVALVEKYIGGNLHHAGNFDAAAPHYQRALTLDEQRLAMMPGNRLVMFDVSIDYSNVASIALAQKRPADAIPGLQRSLAIRAELAQSDPKDVQARSRLAFVSDRLANAYAALSDWPRALEHARGAARISGSIAAVDTDYKLDYSSRLLTLAHVQQRARQPAAGCESLRLAQSLADEVRSGLPPAAPPPTRLRDIDVEIGKVSGECAGRTRADVSAASRASRRR